MLKYIFTLAGSKTVILSKLEDISSSCRSRSSYGLVVAAEVVAEVVVAEV